MCFAMYNLTKTLKRGIIMKKIRKEVRKNKYMIKMIKKEGGKK